MNGQDGNCTDNVCDCGTQPCGEYLFDYLWVRADQLTAVLLHNRSVARTDFKPRNRLYAATVLCCATGSSTSQKLPKHVAKHNIIGKTYFLLKDHSKMADRLEGGGWPPTWSARTQSMDHRTGHRGFSRMPFRMAGGTSAQFDNLCRCPTNNL